jgi:hypothetical protein
MLPGETYRTFEYCHCAREMLEQRVRSSALVYGKVTRLFVTTEPSGATLCEAFYDENAPGWKPGFIFQMFCGPVILLEEEPADYNPKEMWPVSREEFMARQASAARSFKQE